jgi:hypothetical protein
MPWEWRKGLMRRVPDCPQSHQRLPHACMAGASHHHLQPVHGLCVVAGGDALMHVLVRQAHDAQPVLACGNSRRYTLLLLQPWGWRPTCAGVYCERIPLWRLERRGLISSACQLLRQWSSLPQHNLPEVRLICTAQTADSTRARQNRPWCGWSTRWRAPDEVAVAQVQLPRDVQQQGFRFSRAPGNAQQR